MQHSICVVFDGPRTARDAYQSLLASGYAEHADSIAVHYRQLIDGKIPISQTRSRGGMLWGGLSMAVFGAIAALLVLGDGDDPTMKPWMALVIGALFGGAFGALAGMLIGTTDPRPELAKADALLAEGRVALIAEFESAELADSAERRLVDLGGTRLDTARAAHP